MVTPLGYFISTMAIFGLIALYFGTWPVARFMLAMGIPIALGGTLGILMRQRRSRHS